MKIKFLVLVTAITVIASCKTTRQTITQSDPAKTEEKKIPESKIYRASNTRQNDIQHMELRVSFDWDHKYLFGQQTLTIKPHFYPAKMVYLNARGMEIKEVSLLTNVGNRKLAYDYENDSIKIELDKSYTRDETYKIYIDYISKPDELKEVGGSTAITSDKGLYFINADGKEENKPRQLWTQGETQANSVWFPTIDSPNERMTQEIYITVDTSFVTLSNGLLRSSIINEKEGTRTDYWKQSLPHAPYLVMMAIGNFKIVKDKWRNIEVNYYVDPEYEKYAKMIFGNTPEMLEFFSKKLGVDYVWEKYSQVVVHDYVSGAMENTSATLHGELLQRDDRAYLDETHEDFISHELFHQWFGDLVTIESWSNVPLNESFATYGEYLWNEYKYGQEEADYHHMQDMNAYLQQSKTKKVDLIRFDYVSQEEMFDVNSYQRGGCVLHMLRKYVGDDAFFKSLEFYLNTNKFKPVEAHNLRLAFEEVTGEDLNWFFNQWFFNHGNPELEINYSYNDSTGTENVTIEQKQDFDQAPLFRIPLKIDIYTISGTTQHDVVIRNAKETFSFKTNSKPMLVNVDAQKMLICKKTDNHTTDEWIYQYEHTPLFADRYEAVQKLGKNYQAESSAAKIILQALKDKSWAIRNLAIRNSGTLAKPDAKDSRLKEILIDLAKNDTKATVRETALANLAKSFEDQELFDVYSEAVKDQSYDVMEQALKNITSKNKEQGLALAKQYEQENNKRIRRIISGIYAEYGSDDNNRFILNALEQSGGGQKYQMTLDYGKFLTHCKPQTIETGLIALKDVAKNGKPWWVKLAGIQALSELSKTCETKLKELSAANVNTVDTNRYLELKISIDNAIKSIKEDETDKNLKKIYATGSNPRE